MGTLFQSVFWFWMMKNVNTLCGYLGPGWGYLGGENKWLEKNTDGKCCICACKCIYKRRYVCTGVDNEIK